MNVNKIITFFTQSSEDPAKTSATLTGLLIAIAAQTQQNFGFIPAVHDFFLSPLGQQIEPVATAIGTIVGSIVFLFGLYRKLTNKIESSSGLAV